MRVVSFSNNFSEYVSKSNTIKKIILIYIFNTVSIMNSLKYRVVTRYVNIVTPFVDNSINKLSQVSIVLKEM